MILSGTFRLMLAILFLAPLARNIQDNLYLMEHSSPEKEQVLKLLSGQGHF